MIDRNTPSDPRLQERRGDLVGRSALLFAIVVLIAVGAAGAYILSNRPPAESADASASPRSSASSSPVASSTPTRRPSPSPSPSPRPSPSEPPAAPTFPAGTPAELLVAGDAVGTVTATAPRYRGRAEGVRAPEGSRFAVVQISYDATAALSYSAADWIVVDAGGSRHSPAEVQAEGPLGDGELEASEAASGSIVFQVPSDADVAAIILRPEGAPGDLLAFQVP